VAFDEATAILAGDALQCLAFEVLAGAALPEPVRVALLRALASASGSRGMAGGQALDLAAVGGSLDAAALARMHGWKTGALIRAAVRMGALVAGAQDDALRALDRFAAALGLAFQVRDDLLDVEADAATLGKTTGKDARDGKPTYVSVLGVDGARAALDQQARAMNLALASFGGEAAVLRVLGEMAVRRDA
jgi:farnesyl diphosphate synthase